MNPLTDAVEEHFGGKLGQLSARIPYFVGFFGLFAGGLLIFGHGWHILVGAASIVGFVLTLRAG